MAALHVVGSNNGLDPLNQIDPSDNYATPRADRLAEFAAREAAALAWIDTVFNHALVNRSAGVMIALQANPNFEPTQAAQQPVRGLYLDQLGLVY